METDLSWKFSKTLDVPSAFKLTTMPESISCSHFALKQLTFQRGTSLALTPTLRRGMDRSFLNSKI